jgi:hypothetical protein
MLTILLATCEVTRDADIELSRETTHDLERLIQRTRAELDALGDSTTTAHILSPPPHGPRA